jgi:propionyl-CoA synthetase
LAARQEKRSERGCSPRRPGQVPRGYVVLAAGVEVDPEELQAELAALPKTRSGKILRKTMRDIADGKDPAVPSTIEDAGVLETLEPVLRLK